MIPGLEHELLKPRMADHDDISSSNVHYPYAIQTAGEASTAAIERNGRQMSREDLLSGVCAQLMLRLDPPVTSIKLDSFALEMGQRVHIEPDHPTHDHKEYIVSLRPGGGS